LTDPKAPEDWGAPSDEIVLVVDFSDVREGGKDLHYCGAKEEPEFTIGIHWYRLAAPTCAAFTEILVIKGETISVSLVSYGLLESADG